jgi:hypothetical protein
LALMTVLGPVGLLRCCGLAWGVADLPG